MKSQLECRDLSAEEMTETTGGAGDSGGGSLLSDLLGAGRKGLKAVWELGLMAAGFNTSLPASTKK